MLFLARVLITLLFISSLSTLFTFGYFHLKLTKTLSIPKGGAFSSFKSPGAHFDFEKLLARFYLPSEKDLASSPQDLSTEAPRLLAIYWGKGAKLALLRCGEESYWAKEGEKIKGWRIVKIFPDSVELVFKDRKVIQKLFESEPQTFSTNNDVSQASSQALLITREELEKLTADIGSLFAEIRLRPNFRRGKMEGVRVEYVAPGSLFFRAGLRAGDVVLAINDIPVRKNEDAFRIIETLKTAPSLSVKIRRGDKVLTLRAEVQ